MDVVEGGLDFISRFGGLGDSRRARRSGGRSISLRPCSLWLMKKGILVDMVCSIYCL